MPGSADQQGVHFPAPAGVGRLPRGGHRLERHLAELAAPGFGVREHVGHQSTFASVWSSRTSSGTASAPSPTMRPPARSGGKRHALDHQRGCAQLRRLHLERLLLGRHDALERGEPRPGDAFVDREHRRQGEGDGLGGALEIAAGGAASALDLELGDRGDAGKTEQLGDHRTDGAVRGVGGHPAEEDQVVAAVLELGGQRPRDGETVERDLVGLELDRAGRSHGQRLPQDLLHSVGAQRDHHDFAAAGLLHQLQCDLDARIRRSRPFRI